MPGESRQSSLVRERTFHSSFFNKNQLGVHENAAVDAKFMYDLEPSVVLPPNVPAVQANSALLIGSSVGLSNTTRNGVGPKLARGRGFTRKPSLLTRGRFRSAHGRNTSAGAYVRPRDTPRLGSGRRTTRPHKQSAALVPWKEARKTAGMVQKTGYPPKKWAAAPASGLPKT